MRQIGHIQEEAAARVFGDFLYMRGIESQLEHEPGQGWAVWIHDEENLKRAGQLYGEYQADPHHPRFRAQAAGAAALREQARKAQETWAKKRKTSLDFFRPLYAYGFGPVTLLLMIACVAVAFFSRLGDEVRPIYKLFFSEFVRGMPEIRHGEIWRLFTPMLIHFNFLHIFFNLLWLRDLGSALEARQGSLFFILQVLAIAAVSNGVQYALAGPVFGGMSGVVYGLLGYIWIRDKFDPNFGMRLQPTTVTMMAIWFALCFTGILGQVANWCHAAGLAAGLAWGYLAARKTAN